MSDRYQIVYVESRRICWPNPDATCLEGGCLYCNDHPLRPLGQIAEWARTAGQVRHRGNGRAEDALAAYRSGADAGFYDAEVRVVPKRVPA